MYKGIYNDGINKMYESIVWTHKIHRTYLEILEKRRKVISIIEIVFTASAGTATTLFAIFGNNIGTVISSVLTLFSVVFASILEKIETKNDINAFKKSSSSLWLLRCKVEELSQKIKGEIITDDEVCRNLEMIQSMFDNAVIDLPSVPNKVVDIASFKLKDRKDEDTKIKLP